MQAFQATKGSSEEFEPLVTDLCPDPLPLQSDVVSLVAIALG